MDKWIWANGRGLTQFTALDTPSGNPGVFIEPTSSFGLTSFIKKKTRRVPETWQCKPHKVINKIGPAQKKPTNLKLETRVLDSKFQQGFGYPMGFYPLLTSLTMTNKKHKVLTLGNGRESIWYGYPDWLNPKPVRVFLTSVRFSVRVFRVGSGSGFG